MQRAGYERNVVRFVNEIANFYLKAKHRHESERWQSSLSASVIDAASREERETVESDIEAAAWLHSICEDPGQNGWSKE
jgi:hypothetical protein